MRLNILIGGKAGQGINAVSGIVADVLARQGYFSFNYRDYGSGAKKDCATYNNPGDEAYCYLHC